MGFTEDDQRDSSCAILEYEIPATLERTLEFICMQDGKNFNAFKNALK